jgi:hypothetical protein
MKEKLNHFRKFNLVFLIVLIQASTSFSQTIKTINVNTAGTLSTLISEAEQKTITALTLTGNIDARDFVFMRDKMRVLSSVDLTLSTIKSFTGTDGTNTGTMTTYPANEIPAYSFYNPVYNTFKYTLTSFKLPSTTTSIGYLAFYYCTKLAGTVTIPASVKSIADYAFYGCTEISSFSVANNNPRYSSQNGVLFNKNQDTLFIFPGAKSGSYTIPSTVKHIGASAFEGQVNVTQLYFPSTLNSIGRYAFAYCNGISGNLNLPSNLKKIEDGAFYGCSKLNGTVIIPAGLTDFGSYCFFECNNISSFSVSASNTAYASLNDCLYSKNLDTLFICPGGKSGNFSIPANVKLIGSHAFYKCSKLTGNIFIPASVDFIGYYAFYGCSLITGFSVDQANPYFTAIDGVLFSKNIDRLLCCPPTKSGNYVIPSSVKYTDPSAFAYCTNITGQMNIPALLSNLGEYTFYGCNGISGFTVDKSNTRYAAYDGILYNSTLDTLLICPLSKTGKIEVPLSVKSIGVAAFDGCANLTEVNLPASLTIIENYAFEYCTGLTKFRIPRDIQKIGYAAFYNCNALTEVGIENPTPPIIEYYTFDQVNKTTCKLLVPEGAKINYENAPYWRTFEQIIETKFETGINKLHNQHYTLTSYKSIITINGLTQGDLISVFSPNGLLIKVIKSYDTTVSFNLPNQGVYIIKMPLETTKIIL